MRIAFASKPIVRIVSLFFSPRCLRIKNAMTLPMRIAQISAATTTSTHITTRWPSRMVKVKPAVSRAVENRTPGILASRSETAAFASVPGRTASSTWVSASGQSRILCIPATSITTKLERNSPNRLLSYTQTTRASVIAFATGAPATASGDLSPTPQAPSRGCPRDGKRDLVANDKVTFVVLLGIHANLARTAGSESIEKLIPLPSHIRADDNHTRIVGPRRELCTGRDPRSNGRNTGRCLQFRGELLSTLKVVHHVTLLIQHRIIVALGKP